MRKWLIGLVVLVALLVAADRIAVHVATREVADRIQSSERLATPPTVGIGGFPFLTQAVAGDYQHVTVAISDLHSGALVMSRVNVALSGVHVPLSRLFSGSTGPIPIDSATGQVSITYAELNKAVSGVTVAYGGTPGTVLLRSTQLPVTATATLTVSNDELRTALKHVNILGIGLPGGGLSFAVSLAGLPFGVALTGVTSSPAGVTVSAGGTNLTVNPATTG